MARQRENGIIFDILASLLFRNLSLLLHHPLNKTVHCARSRPKIGRIIDTLTSLHLLTRSNNIYNKRTKPVFGSFRIVVYVVLSTISRRLTNVQEKATKISSSSKKKKDLCLDAKIKKKNTRERKQRVILVSSSLHWVSFAIEVFS